jgi:hypothetical protein
MERANAVVNCKRKMTVKFRSVDMSCNEPKKSILNGAEVSIGSIGSLNLISY